MRCPSLAAPSFRALLCVLIQAPLLAACSDTDEDPPPAPAGCDTAALKLEPGDPNGHKDPFGAKAAGQARAGKVTDLAGIAQPGHGRQKIEPGDFVLANDKIVVFIEDKDFSDGYARFGGEILSIDKANAEGKPTGISMYGETLTGLSIEMVDPTSVTVLKDGSDGGEAVVRVTGKLSKIPFMQGPLEYLFPRAYELEAAYDYVLRPGEERVTMRVGVVNATNEPIDFGTDRPDPDELLGFFHYSNAQLVTPEFGFEEPSGRVAWAGYDGGDFGFAFRFPDNDLAYGLTVSGFSLFYGPGFVAEACSAKTADRMDIIAGGPDYDGLREAVRRATGEAPWREVTGKVEDAQGNGVPGAWLHAVSAEGAYLSRTRTGSDGSFVVHVPPGAPVTLVPQKRGFAPHAGFGIGADEATATIPLDPNGTIHVVAKDAATAAALPVRVQVVPQDSLAGSPEAFGTPDETNGRLHQVFAMDGDATVSVPPGQHSVIVSRGYEWELVATDVTVAAGETLEVPVDLAHSVDTAGVMCADFHIHSQFSADSNDRAVQKVRGAIADGLDIPVSSEHEWVEDFQPLIQDMGLTQWAFGMASEELTTFKWGHFGVVPMTPDPTKANNGAVDWIGKDPKDVFALVRALPENPVLIVNHPSGGGFGAYFSAAGLDRKTGKGRDGFWSDDFDAIEVFNDSDFEANRKDSVADWFALLEAGMTFWAVGSSDSHHLRTSPIGYPRTCLSFGHDDPTMLTKEMVRDAIASGASTISGGLYMTATGPNGESPGQMVQAGAGGMATFTITIESASWVNADTLETIVNGQTVSTEALIPVDGWAGPSKKYSNQVTVTLDPSRPRNWVLFHAKGAGDLAPLHPGRRPFAVANPFFLKP
ncbi:CehA/McbA family metallohydrolase [Polyangium spumosum]|uniref:Carboxypeptidase regulatory-like domain-containing protein n=1 Tax=Polyangium spumosum TaxID=889282 RepID=A0A6N7PUD1_9BACT|nr:CehA/McbA family metallohydrolase [Polyangium spumosum]MRG94030.1 hypothetical protein [Polyangium spumosum]